MGQTEVLGLQAQSMISSQRTQHLERVHGRKRTAVE
jgi:hypothetical protein